MAWSQVHLPPSTHTDGTWSDASPPYRWHLVGRVLAQMSSQSRLQLVEEFGVVIMIDAIGFDQIDQALGQRNLAAEDVLEVVEDVLALRGKLRHQCANFRLRQFALDFGLLNAFGQLA